VSSADASPVVVLRAADGAVAHVSRHGAHIMSWRPASDGRERLFLSKRSEHREGVAIRGGVPVIFPQFAAEGPLPRHGFARTMRWTLEQVVEQNGVAGAIFTLRDTEATRAIWPASFVARLRPWVIDDRLKIGFDVTNTGDVPFTFTAALHTYLRVNDVASTTLEGLRGVRYRETSAPGVLTLDQDERIHPGGEVDRVYVDATTPLLLRDSAGTLEIEASFPDVVVWNPGSQKAALLADMEPGGERRMLCVEAAAVQRPVTLVPGDQWARMQTLRVRSRQEDRGLPFMPQESPATYTRKA